MAVAAHTDFISPLYSGADPIFSSTLAIAYSLTVQSTPHAVQLLAAKCFIHGRCSLRMHYADQKCSSAFVFCFCFLFRYTIMCNNPTQTNLIKSLIEQIEK